MHSVVAWSDIESDKTSPENEVLPVDVESNSSSESEAPLAKMQKSKYFCFYFKIRLCYIFTNRRFFILFVLMNVLQI